MASEAEVSSAIFLNPVYCDAAQRTDARVCVAEGNLAPIACSCLLTGAAKPP